MSFYHNEVLKDFQGQIVLQFGFYKRHSGIQFWLWLPLLVAENKKDDIRYQADDDCQQSCEPEAQITEKIDVDHVVRAVNEEIV